MQVIMDPIPVPRELLIRVKQAVIERHKLCCGNSKCRDSSIISMRFRPWACDRHYHSGKLIEELRHLLCED